MYQIELELGGKSGVIDRSSDVVVPNVSMRKPIAAGNMERVFSAFLKATKVFPFSYVAEIFRARTCMHSGSCVGFILFATLTTTPAAKDKKIIQFVTLGT